MSKILLVVAVVLTGLAGGVAFWLQHWSPSPAHHGEKEFQSVVARGYILKCSPGRCRVGPAFGGLDPATQTAVLLVVYNYLWRDWPQADQSVLQVENPDGTPLGRFTPEQGLTP